MTTSLFLERCGVLGLFFFMQVTKEIATLRNANEGSFAAVGVTIDEEHGTVAVGGGSIDTPSSLKDLESTWDGAEAKTEWKNLEVGQIVLSLQVNVL